MQLTDFIVKRTSKKELAEALNITPQWLYGCYLKLANQSSDFNTDYPQLGTEYRTRIGLTDYQVWVVKSIFQLIQGGMRTEEIVYQDEEGFTKFNEKLDQFLSKANYQQTQITQAS